jgi:hypothetical protein
MRSLGVARPYAFFQEIRELGQGTATNTGRNELIAAAIRSAVLLLCRKRSRFAGEGDSGESDCRSDDEKDNDGLNVHIDLTKT